MDLGFVTVPSIVAMCLLVGVVVKATPLDSKWIPIIVGVSGAILGAVGYLTVPGLIDGNIYNSIAVGIASGLAATGAHQIYAQLGRDDA